MLKTCILGTIEYRALRHPLCLAGNVQFTLFPVVKQVKIFQYVLFFLVIEQSRLVVVKVILVQNREYTKYGRGWLDGRILIIVLSKPRIAKLNQEKVSELMRQHNPQLFFVRIRMVIYD